MTQYAITYHAEGGQIPSAVGPFRAKLRAQRALDIFDKVCADCGNDEAAPMLVELQTLEEAISEIRDGGITS